MYIHRGANEEDDSVIMEEFGVDYHSILTVDELALFLRVKRSTVYKLAQKGQIPGFKVGALWRFRVDTISKWMEKAFFRPESNETAKVS